MHRHIAIGLVILTLTISSSLGQESPASAPTSAPTTSPAGLDKLIEQLGSTDWKIRDAAQTLIVNMGEGVRERITDLAARTDDPEVRQRANDILRQITSADFTKPTLVSLHFKNAPPRQVYESLFQQADARLSTWPDSLFDHEVKDPVTIDLDNVPFWQAIDELSARTGLTMEDMGREMRLTRRRDRGDAGPVSISGPFMVVADQSFGQGSFHRFKVRVEPRIHVLAHAMEPEIEVVTDAQGNAPPQVAGMMAAGMGLHRVRQMNEGGGNAFDVHLMMPVNRATHIKGTVAVVVRTKQQTIEIKDIAKANNVDRNVEGRHFMLNAMNPEPGDWYITVIAYNTKPPTPGLQEMNATLLDAAGNSLQLGGHGSSGNGSRVAFDLNFQQGPNCGRPEKLVLVFPLETQEINVPFEFKK